VRAAASLRFSTAAKLLADQCRRDHLLIPGFRSPPRVDAVDRTIRRTPNGTVVAVRLRGREHRDVLADMVEGVVVANDLVGEAADRCREQLWAALAPVLADADGDGGEPAAEAA
jgi:hypothetical protein